MRAKFSDLTYEGTTAKSCCSAKDCGEAQPWVTPEQITVKGTYTAEDLEGMEHLNYAAGIAPFLRGPYSTMYVMRPWTASRPPPNPTHSTAVTSPRARKACRWRSTSLRTAATMPTIRA